MLWQVGRGEGMRTFSEQRSERLSRVTFTVKEDPAHVPAVLRLANHAEGKLFSEQVCENQGLSKVCSRWGKQSVDPCVLVDSHRE